MHRLLALLIALGPMAACTDDPNGPPPEEDACHGPDGPLDEGETFGDACNFCTCNSDGTITCEETDQCEDCEADGTGYAIGDTWPAGDGCNICQCEAKDTVTCTMTPCM